MGRNKTQKSVIFPIQKRNPMHPQNGGCLKSSRSVLLNTCVHLIAHRSFTGRDLYYLIWKQIWSGRQETEQTFAAGCFLTVISIYRVGNILVKLNSLGIYYFIDSFPLVQPIHLFTVLEGKSHYVVFEEGERRKRTSLKPIRWSAWTVVTQKWFLRGMPEPMINFCGIKPYSCQQKPEVGM